MTNFITTFKAKAHTKTLTAGDMIALCIYKTVKAKSENKSEVLKHYLKKSFSAGKMCGHRQYPYQAIINNRWMLSPHAGRRWVNNGFVATSGTALGVPMNELMDETDIILFREIFDYITPDFVRNL